MTDRKKDGSIILIQITYCTVYLLRILSILPSRVAQQKLECDKLKKQRKKKKGKRKGDLEGVGDLMKERCISRFDMTISVYQKDNESFFFGGEMKGAVKARRCVSIQSNYKYMLIPRLRTVKMIFSIRLLRNERCICSFFFFFFFLAVSRVIEIMER